MYYAPLYNHVDGFFKINYFKKNTIILLFINMVRKVYKESIYKEYERYICNEMDDNEKSEYVKSKNFFLVTRINLDIK
tara:strand:- start:448 stop:681 length:234 start_codon:yes stop_codon:yes gene_type:complete